VNLGVLGPGYFEGADLKNAMSTREKLHIITETEGLIEIKKGSKI
jgi:hypothetical protein